MAIVEGIVTGIIRDANTGKVKRTFQENNHVSEWQLDEFTTGEGSQQFGRRVYVSDFPYNTTDRQTTTYGSVNGMAVGFEVNPVAETIGTTTPKVPHILQFHNRFNPPSADRTIEVVGLTPDTGVTNSAFISPSQAMVRLSSTCIQTTTETLDVFYRIQFPWEFDWINDNGATIDDYGNTYYQALILYNRSKASTDTGEWPDAISSGYGHCDPRSIPRTRAGITASNADYPLHEVFSGTFSIGSNTTYSSNQMNASSDIADGVGKIYNYFRYGGAPTSNDQSWYHAKAQPVGYTPVQNMFGHGAGADSPFFDAGNLPGGTASVAIGGDSWTNPNFPKMYRINITNSGSIGAAEYQIWERSVAGFLGNTYHNTARFIGSGYSGSDYLVYDGFNLNNESTTDGWAPRFRPYYPDIGKCLAFRTSDMLAWDVSKESGTRFYDTNFPTWGATDIGDYGIQTDGTVYVSCRDTGLYKIDDPFGSPAITLIDDTTTGLTGTAGPNVYAVAVGRNDRVWIMMDGGLFYSDNSGTSWTQATFSFTDISNSLWSRVVGLQADPEHADDRLGIMYGSPSNPNNDYRICWYDLNSTTAVAGTYITQHDAGEDVQGSFRWGSDRKHTIIDLLLVSRTQGKWGISCRRTSPGTASGFPAYFTFGTTSTLTSGTDNREHASGSFITDDDGNQSILGLEYQDHGCVIFKDTNVTQVYDYSSSSTNWDQLGSNTQGGMLEGGHCHLGQGVFFSNHYQWYMQIGVLGIQDGPDGISENIIWRKYGWDGGAWVEGHSGSKVTHSSEDAIIHGLTIQFDDDSGADNYVDGDYYTVGVMDGIWLDGSTEFDHTADIYYKPIQDQTELEISVIPGTTVLPGAILERSNNAHTWQDVTGTVTTTTSAVYLSSNYNTSDFSRGARSVTTVGGALPTSPGGQLDNKQVQMQAQMRGTSTPWDGTNAGQMVWGMSDPSVAGNPITYGGVQYGFYIDGRANTANEQVSISVIESGTILYTFPELVNGQGINDGTGNMNFRIILLDDGTLQYHLGEGAIIYESTANPTGTYLMEFAMHGDAHTGMMDCRMWGPYTTPIRAFELGTSGSPPTGRYVDGYQTSDSGRSVFYIDGTPATIILDNSMLTAPSAGEIVLARANGYFKVSDSDVGKSVSAEYVIVTNPD